MLNEWSLDQQPKKITYQLTAVHQLHILGLPYVKQTLKKYAIFLGQNKYFLVTLCPRIPKSSYVDPLGKSPETLIPS